MNDNERALEHSKRLLLDSSSQPYELTPATLVVQEHRNATERQWFLEPNILNNQNRLMGGFWRLHG
jgi:hypothetical protein